MKPRVTEISKLTNLKKTLELGKNGEENVGVGDRSEGNATGSLEKIMGGGKVGLLKKKGILGNIRRLGCNNILKTSLEIEQGNGRKLSSSSWEQNLAPGMKDDWRRRNDQ